MSIFFHIIYSLIYIIGKDFGCKMVKIWLKSGKFEDFSKKVANF